MKRFFARLATGLLCAGLLAGCTAKEEVPGGAGGSTRRAAVNSAELQFQPPQTGDTVATIRTDRGDIFVVLYERYAPLAVENFQLLAEAGYYEGSAFHRVVEDFVIQGGDPTGTGIGGESAWGKPFLSEYTNKLHHYAGALCMALADGQRNTNGSQFYIVASPQGAIGEEAAERLRAAGLAEAVVSAYRQAGGEPYLDYTDTVFGQVYAGMDVVDAIAGAAVAEDGSPKNPAAILSVSFGTHTAPAAPPEGIPSGAASSPMPSSPDTPLPPEA